MKLRIHPVATWLPLITGPAYAQFKEDIRVHGVRKPALVWHEPGQSVPWLIDGRNRHRACADLKITLPTEEWNGDGSIVELVASLNFHRRDLTISQRAMFAARAMKYLEEEARKRQAHGQTGPGRTLPASLPEAFKGDARDQAAKLANVSGRSVSDAKAVLANAHPDVIHEVEKGTVSVSDAKKATKVSKTKQLAALKKVHAKAAETLAEVCEADDREAAIKRGLSKLRGAKKAFDSLEGKAARAIVTHIDAALELAGKL